MKVSVKQKASIESEILKRVRAHPGISRILLSNKLGIAPSTAGSYVGRLVAEGFLVESETVDGQEGRPPTALQLNPAGGQFIGVDFEARSMMATAVDFSAHPLKQVRRDIQKSDSVRQVIKKLEESIVAVLPENQQSLLAIGIGVPGLVDPDKGIAVDYKYIHGWRNVPLAKPLAERFGVPVYLENTTRSMALAELWFGQGRGVSDWVCIGIRSGVGAGIVAGGQLQRGAHYQSGEIGRWRCPWPEQAAARFFTAENSARTRDTELQEIASARALLSAWERAHKTKPGTSVQYQWPAVAEVAHAAQEGNELTIRIIGVAAETLGWAVSQLAFALNPSRIILAGPLTLLGDTLLEPMRRRVQDILQRCGTDVPTMVNSIMGEYGGALGAAALAVHEWKPTCSHS